VKKMLLPLKYLQLFFSPKKDKVWIESLRCRTHAIPADLFLQFAEEVRRIRYERQSSASADDDTTPIGG
jgi:hypothetical protein